MNKLSLFLITLLTILLLLNGCTEESKELSNYHCTSEQLKLVKIELDICNSTNYRDSYCFLQAKKSHCSVFKTISKYQLNDKELILPAQTKIHKLQQDKKEYLIISIPTYNSTREVTLKWELR